MRVLLVHHAWPPESAFGSELYAAALARELGREHEVTALHRSADPLRPDGDVRELVHDGLRVISLNNLHRVHPGFESYQDPLVAAVAARLIEALRPDVVHVGHLSGLSTGLVFEARARGAAVVMTLHDFATLCPLGQLLNTRLEVCPGPTPRRCLDCVGGQVAPAPRAASGLAGLPLAGTVAAAVARLAPGAERRIARRLETMRAVLRECDVLVSPSRFVRDRFARLGIDGIEVLPNAHEPLPARSPRADPEGRVRFGFLGAGIPSKGVHILAEAFRRLDSPRAALRIHGPFPPYHGEAGYEARVRVLLGSAASEALRGPFAPEGLPDVLAGLDVVVAPSLWEENAPLVVQEAFLARRPLVVSGHGGLAEMVRDGVDGLHVPPGDARALAAALRRLVEEPGLRERLGTAPPEVMGFPEHGVRLIGLYERARARHAARPGRPGVVVLDHGRPRDALRAAASALDPRLAVPVVLVSNGTAAPAEALPGVEPLPLPRNLGYAGGMNAGIERLRARGCDRVLLLNNDATLAPGALRRLAEALEDATLGAVAPLVVRDSDGRVESRGARFDPASGRFHLLGHGEDPVDEEGQREVPALTGAALMLSGPALARVGLLDERYFHSFEDVDWCLRARASGLRLAVVLGARAFHAGAQTLGPRAPERLYYAARNHVVAAERMQPLRGLPRLLRLARIAGFNLVHAAAQREVPRGAGLRAAARGVRDGLRGRGGPLPGAIEP
jgi:GT2 family glycosyltransferase/glycosyltransferase involved in cell wall biosynthesis